MKVSEAMVKAVSVCKPQDNLAQIAAVMWNGCCGTLPVIDEAGGVISMITDRDICIALGTRNARASELRVQDVSLPRVFTCHAKDDVEQALQTMVAQNVRRLPVVDAEGRIAGILSLDDLIGVSTETARDGGVSHREVVLAARAILEERIPGHAHPAGELVAV